MPRTVEIAGMVCPNDCFLAPMAGYTNYPFRKVCEEMGAGFAFTEMVSAKGLHYGNAETRQLLARGETERVAVQLFGSDPALLREACESEALAPFPLVDLNMGCPMPKIVKNGEGSALMENFPLAEKIVSACVKSGKRVSVKFRTGIAAGKECAAEFARLCEGAGACLVTIHGRTRDKIYAGEVNFKEIAAAKRAVKIPVAASGGVQCARDADRVRAETGADAVVIARAALSDPRIFCDLTGRPRPPLLPLFCRELEETRALYGERFACVFMRKMAAFYLKGRQNAAEGKRRFFAARTTDEVRSLAEEWLEGV